MISREELQKMIEEEIFFEDSTRQSPEKSKGKSAYWNAGNVTEGIYAAGLAAAFWRAPQKITFEDLNEVLIDLLEKTSPDSWLTLTPAGDTGKRETLTATYQIDRSKSLCKKVQVPPPKKDLPEPNLDIRRPPVDTIKLMIGLDTKDLQWLLYLVGHGVKPKDIAEDKWAKMIDQFQGALHSVVQVVNEPHVTKFTHYFSCDGYSNTVLVKAAGVENQTGGATDVYVATEQVDEAGKKVESILSDDLNESLKTFDTQQVYQAGQTWSIEATQVAKGQELGTDLSDEERAKIKQGVVDFFRVLFGVSPPSELKNIWEEAVVAYKTNKDYEAIGDAIAWVYESIVVQLQKKIFDDDKKIVPWLKEFFTINLKNAINAPTILKLKAGVSTDEAAKLFKRLSTTDITKWFEEKGIELEDLVEIDFDPGGPYIKKKWPRIEMRWNDKTFFIVRPKLENPARGGRVSHYFEMPEAFYEVVGEFMKADKQIKEQTKHLTNTPITAKMLQEMIDDLLSKK